MFDPTDARTQLRDHERAMGTRQHPAHPDGRGSIQGDSLPLLFLLYIEPLPGGSTSAGVDTDSAACPPKTAPDTKSVRSRMLTTSTVSRRRSPTYACRHKTQHLCKRIQSAHKWGKTVATALHRDVHTKLCTVTEMPRRVARS
jgi:hypothetical protein